MDTHDSFCVPLAQHVRQQLRVRAICAIRQHDDAIDQWHCWASHGVIRQHGAINVWVRRLQHRAM
eukprot:6885845-Prymnesium_polylepis.1